MDLVMCRLNFRKSRVVVNSYLDTQIKASSYWDIVYINRAVQRFNSAFWIKAAFFTKAQMQFEIPN